MLSNLKDKQSLVVEKENLEELFEDVVFQDAFCKKLEAFLPEKRWYSAKDDVICAVSFQAIFYVKDICFLVVLVALKSGEKPTFLIPLRIAFEDSLAPVDENHIITHLICEEKRGAIYDCASDKDFSSTILPLLQEDVSETVGEGMILSGSSTVMGKTIIKNVVGLPQKTLGVEQSNTSLIVGKKVMLKMYRRTAFGSHPEVATTRFLTEEAKFKNTPAYLGQLELKYADNKTMALGILQSFVPNLSDGWSYTMDYLKGFFTESIVEKKISTHKSYLMQIKLLGQRTAEMHRAFARGQGEVFEPDIVTAEDMTAWREQVIAQLEKTIQVAQANVESLSGDVKAKTQKLIDSKEDLIERISDLLPPVADGRKTRFHGDYHLGQVVIDETGDFYILDFEGEPLRPITERQVKQSVLKDVAGMVRSFDYAAFGAVLLYVLPENRAAVLPLAAKWKKMVTAAFLEGYFNRMAGCVSLPADKDTTLKLLDLFILEKALYEVVYEVANRPDWLAIPMNGLSHLLDLDGE